MNSGDEVAYRQTRIAHWDALARRMDTWAGWSGYYHRRLEEVYRFVVPPGHTVLEVGCGHGDLLAALQPSFGLGVDFSGEMIQRARERHPELQFVMADAHQLELTRQFDFIILSDLVNDVWDVQTILECVRCAAGPRTRVVLNFYSRLWEIPLKLAEGRNLGKPTLPRELADQ